MIQGDKISRILNLSWVYLWPRRRNLLLISFLEYDLALHLKLVVILNRQLQSINSSYTTRKHVTSKSNPQRPVLLHRRKRQNELYLDLSRSALTRSNTNCWTNATFDTTFVDGAVGDTK